MLTLRRIERKQALVTCRQELRANAEHQHQLQEHHYVDTRLPGWMGLGLTLREVQWEDALLTAEYPITCGELDGTAAGPTGRATVSIGKVSQLARNVATGKEYAGEKHTHAAV